MTNTVGGSKKALGPYKKQMPKGEARPLGTPRPKAGKRSQPKKNLTLVKNNSADDAENAGQNSEGEVSSDQSGITPNSETQTAKEKTMTLTFKSLNQKGTAAIYSGLKTSVRFSLAAFKDRQYPQTIEANSDAFAEAAVKTPKVKLTAEERKALRASQPKPTLAERIAKREASLAALKAKAAASAQPSL